MWFDEAVVYQIYPLGLCDALDKKDSDHRILRILDWVDHIKKTGATCVLFNPLMESDYHGYDTRDYLIPDHRLGTEKDLQKVCRQSMTPASRSCSTAFSTMWDGDSGLSGMCRRRNGIALTAAGSISILTAIPITTTASGTKDGKVITNSSN